jgi:hypothetical protein
MAGLLECSYQQESELNGLRASAVLEDSRSGPLLVIGATTRLSSSFSSHTARRSAALRSTAEVGDVFQNFSHDGVRDLRRRLARFPSVSPDEREPPAFELDALEGDGGGTSPLNGR